MIIKKKWKEKKSDFSEMKIVNRRANEAKKSETKEKQLVNFKMGKENLKNITFLHEEFFLWKGAKKKRYGQVQRLSRGAEINEWQLNAHRLDSLNCVATRSNGQESPFNRARDPQCMWI